MCRDWNGDQVSRHGRAWQAGPGQVETAKWRHTFAVCASEGPPYDGVGVGFHFFFFISMGLFVFIEPPLNFPRACSVLCLYFEIFRIHWKDQNNNNPETTEKKQSLEGVLGWCWIIDSVRNTELVSGSQTYSAKMQFRHKGNALKYESSMSANIILSRMSMLSHCTCNGTYKS